MLELGPLEVVLVLVYVTGVACAVVGALTARFDLRERILALLFSLGVPVVGSLVVVVMLIRKLGGAPPQDVDESA
jgi:heme A synthase